MKEFFKINEQKILVTLVSYAVFYILDQMLLTPVEKIYLPEIVSQLATVSSLFWVLRFFQEIITFYAIACFAYWYITSDRKNKIMEKGFFYYLIPNRINLIVMLGGYAIFYIFNALLYIPINDLFMPPTEIPTTFPLTLILVRLFFDLATFYIIGSFAHWLIVYFKKGK